MGGICQSTELETAASRVIPPLVEKMRDTRPGSGYSSRRPRPELTQDLALLRQRKLRIPDRAAGTKRTKSSMSDPEAIGKQKLQIQGQNVASESKSSGQHPEAAIASEPAVSDGNISRKKEVTAPVNESKRSEKANSSVNKTTDSSVSTKATKQGAHTVSDRETSGISSEGISTILQGSEFGIMSPASKKTLQMMEEEVDTLSEMREKVHEASSEETQSVRSSTGETSSLADEDLRESCSTSSGIIGRDSTSVATKTGQKAAPLPNMPLDPKVHPSQGYDAPPPPPSITQPLANAPNPFWMSPHQVPMVQYPYHSSYYYWRYPNFNAAAYQEYQANTLATNQTQQQQQPEAQPYQYCNTFYTGQQSYVNMMQPAQTAANQTHRYPTESKASKFDQSNRGQHRQNCPYHHTASREFKAHAPFQRSELTDGTPIGEDQKRGRIATRMLQRANQFCPCFAASEAPNSTMKEIRKQARDKASRLQIPSRAVTAS
ncbi:MAG: hypothetical protein MHMPM18_004145 [Marteilia pararefringens]